MIAGVDEAGRGPLVGPVVVAAVILDTRQDWSAIDDSKRLSASVRETLATDIKSKALSYSVVVITRHAIDQLNILQATMLGMQRAVCSLNLRPSEALIDGNRCPDLPMPARAIVGGDGSESCIGAASILAKVTRDALLVDMASRYPHYGLERNKGYPTAEHLEALRIHGPCPEHRRSFGPVRNLLQTNLFNA